MMSVDAFCDLEMMPGEDRQAFKAWLGNTANAKMSHKDWRKWFSEWVRCKSQ